MNADPRRRGATRALATLLLGALVATGCASAHEKTYYNIVYSPAASPTEAPDEAAPSLAGVLQVETFAVDPAYDNEKIVYRLSPWEARYYNYKLWATRPDEMVTAHVARYLDESGLFANVVRSFPSRPPELLLTGRIEAIEEVDEDDGWYAHLALELRLRRPDDGRLVWSHRIDERRLASERTPVAVARALSELLHEAMAQALPELRSALAAAAPRPPEP